MSSPLDFFILDAQRLASHYAQSQRLPPEVAIAGLVIAACETALVVMPEHEKARVFQMLHQVIRDRGESQLPAGGKPTG